MKKVFVALMIAVMGLSVGMSNVEAKRLGGGSSFGKSSPSAQRQATTPSAAPSATKPAAAGATGAAPAKPSSPWKGILGGALLGLGLGALLSHLGLGGAMASMISTILMVALIAIVGLFIYRMVRRKMGGAQPAYASASNNNAFSGNQTPQIGSLLEKTAINQPAAAAAAVGGAPVGMEQASGYGIPADFDAAGFARNAKVHFIRLQAAWDKADLDDIREFTTPEMFAEIKMQLSERGASENQTDVVSIDAEVLGVETIGNDYLASVRFFGFIKEDVNASPAQFTEIWNMSKPVSGNGGWLLAGIQQIA
jgi:predicted lipid-binding transport protein (Tim44 family)